MTHHWEVPPDVTAAFVPTQEEIAKRAAEVRSKWDKRTEQARTVQKTREIEYDPVSIGVAPRKVLKKLQTHG